MFGAVASVPLVHKLGSPYVVERPWSPSVADHLACLPSDVVARLPLPVGVLESLGLPVALNFPIVVLAPVLEDASWPSAPPTQPLCVRPVVSPIFL